MTFLNLGIPIAGPSQLVFVRTPSNITKLTSDDYLNALPWIISLCPRLDTLQLINFFEWAQTIGST